MANYLPSIKLRPTVDKDLHTLFQFQLDKEAAHLAAFISKDPSDKQAYLTKFASLLANPSVNNQTILLEDVIVGSIAKFYIENDAEVTYWIDKMYWGQGIATTALKKFLAIENTRPLFARVAFDNIASQKVLEKCGFEKVGKDSGFANARQMEIAEIIYQLS